MLKKIQEELQQALKAGDKLKVSTLRLLRVLPRMNEKFQSVGRDSIRAFPA